MASDEDIKILTEQKDKRIEELKKEIDLLNNALYKANKKVVALHHEIEEFNETGDIKKGLKEYMEANKHEN